MHTFFPKFLTVRRTLESAWADTPLTKPKSTYEIDAKVTAALAWFRGELNPSLGPTKLEIFDQMHRLYQKNQQVGQLEQAARLIDEHDADDETDDWADRLKFSEMTFSAQRVLLFIRAVIRNPDLVVLDEAFSGMDDAARDKCILFLSRGQNATFRFKQTTHASIPLIRKPSIQESYHSRLGRVTIQGLQDHQALIVISHKKEEVPGCVRNWICLAQSGQGAPRTGELLVPLELKVNGWNEIWGTRILPMRVARDEGLSRPGRKASNKSDNGGAGEQEAKELPGKTRKQNTENQDFEEKRQRKRLVCYRNLLQRTSLIQCSEQRKTLEDEPCQISETNKREEYLAKCRAASQRYRDNLTGEKREKVLEQARIRSKIRSERLRKVSKAWACMSGVARLAIEG